MEAFKLQIISLFNENQLPLDCKYYVLKDVFRMVEDTYSQMLAAAAKEKEPVQEEETEASA